LLNSVFLQNAFISRESEYTFNNGTCVQFNFTVIVPDVQKMYFRKKKQQDSVWRFFCYLNSLSSVDFIINSY